jgi:5'-3' exonuclease, N-terminal resolvase-like domain
MQTNVIIDLSNLTHVTHHSILRKSNGVFSKNYLIFRTIEFITFIAKKYKADGILVACDSPNIWRKDIYPAYKKNRDANRDPYYEEVKEGMIEIKDFFNVYTAIPAVAVERCEADDIISIAAGNKSTKNVIISSDKDFMQLINDNTILYSPSQKEERVSEDRDYELFEKCIRGDNGDNIKSSYPRVRATRLKQAWDDKHEMINLMETHVPATGRTVKEVYNFNKILIDLSLIPDYIKQSIENSLNSLAINKYNSISVMRFIGEHDMKNISSDFLKHKEMFRKSYIQNS